MGDIRVGIIGDSGVGKSSVVKALLNPGDRNWLYFPTAGSHVSMLCMSGPKLVHFEDDSTNPAPENFFVELWDIGGNLRYRAARKSLLGECEGFIFVWDAEHDSTFASLERWLEDVLESMQCRTDDHEDYYGEDLDGVRSRQQSVDIIDTPGRPSSNVQSPVSASTASPESDWSPTGSRGIKRHKRKRTRSSSSVGSPGSGSAGPAAGGPSSGVELMSSLSKISKKYSSGKLSSIGELTQSSLRQVQEQNSVTSSTSLIDNSHTNRSLHGRYVYTYEDTAVASKMGKRSNRSRGDSLVGHLGIQTPLKGPVPSSEALSNHGDGPTPEDADEGRVAHLLPRSSFSQYSIEEGQSVWGRAISTAGYWRENVRTFTTAVGSAIDSVALVTTRAADSAAEAAMGPAASASISARINQSAEAEETDLLLSRTASPDFSLDHDEENALSSGRKSPSLSRTRTDMATTQMAKSETNDQGNDTGLHHDSTPLDDEAESIEDSARGLSGLPLMIVGNKIDKLSASQMERLRRTCSNHVFVASTSETTPFDPRSFDIFFSDIYHRKMREEFAT